MKTEVCDGCRHIQIRFLGKTPWCNKWDLPMTVRSVACSAREPGGKVLTEVR